MQSSRLKLCKHAILHLRLSVCPTDIIISHLACFRSSQNQKTVKVILNTSINLETCT